MRIMTLCKTFENKNLAKLGVSVQNWFSKQSDPNKEIVIVNTSMAVKGDNYALVMIYKEKIQGEPRVASAW